MTRLGKLCILFTAFVLVALAVYWLWLSKRAGRQGGDSDWNVILISLDTCRADRLSLYGATRPNSPGLDAFAVEAVVWDDCLAQSTGTGPSHRSLFSGQYVHRHGMHDNYYNEPHYSMASLLRDHGYQTAAFTGGGYMRSRFGFDHGFDVFLGVTLPVPPEGAPNWRYLDEVLPQAEGWLAQKQPGKYFLFLHAYDPHCPYWPDEVWRRRYASGYAGDLDPESLCGPKDFQPLIDSGAFGPAERKYLNDLYDATIASSDAALTRFLHALRDSGQLEQSVLIFTSDHGESLGEHDWVGHTRMGEEQIRVPLLVRFPGGRWAGRRSEPVQHVDLLPTLLDALGLPAPEGIQGLSLMPYLRGEEAAPAERLRVCEFGNREAVRYDTRWKISFRRPKGVLGPPQLFDLENDPRELRDLALTEEGSRHAQAILQRYLEWREQTAAEDERHRGRERRAELTEAEARGLEELGYTESGPDED